MRTTRLLLPCALLAALAVGTVLPGTAHASCAVRPVEGALSQPVQFVGRVLEPERQVTRFRVEQVWVGPDLASTVWVDTGGRTSSALHPEAGERYLVGAGGDLGTSSCTAALITDEAELAALRPATVRVAVGDGLEGEGPRQPVLLSGLAVLLGGVVVHRLLRRRRSAGGPVG